MKLSKSDLQILAFMSKECKSIVLTKDILASNETRSALFSAKLEAEDLSNVEIGLYNLFEFLNVLTFMGGEACDIKIEKNRLIMYGDKAKGVYYTTPLNCLTIPSKLPTFDKDSAALLNLDETRIKQILKGARVMGNDIAMFEFKGDSAYITTTSQNIPEASHFQVDISDNIQYNEKVNGKFTISLDNFNPINGNHTLYFKSGVPFIVDESISFPVTSYIALKGGNE